jgi:Lipoprotein LpqB beta-propeller domain
VRAGTARTIDAPGISGADVTTFSLSRDGTRLVALVRRGGRDVVLVSRVRRDVKGRVLGVGAPHRLDLGRTTGRVRDIAWRTPASLAVLVAPTPDSSQVEVVKVDGSSSAANLSTDPELFRARATRLVTAPARGTPLFVETRDDRLYSLSRNGRWRRSVIEPGLRSPTFVG